MKPNLQKPRSKAFLGFKTIHISSDYTNTTFNNALFLCSCSHRCRCLNQILHVLLHVTKAMMSVIFLDKVPLMVAAKQSATMVLMINDLGNRWGCSKQLLGINKLLWIFDFFFRVE
jgi:hypothetical protein